MSDGIVVIGSGGHAKVVIELLRAMGETVAWCVGGVDGGSCVGVAVLGGDEHLARLHASGHRRAFVGIGDNDVRARLADVAIACGFDLVNAVSPRAVISPSARFGRGVAIMAGAVINAEAFVDDLAIVNTGATVDHDCRIGRAVHVAPQCGLAGNVIVGERTLLGIGSTVLPKVRIGAGVTVGAGSVVIHDIPDGTLAMGVSAKVVQRAH